MSNEVQLFNHEEFGSIRTVNEGGDILFCARDVALALGYAKPNNAITQHCKGTLKRGTLPTDGGAQEFVLIAEPDVFRLIVSSKLPSAQKFEAWVFEEVLPSIRRTGGYMVTGNDETPEETMARALLIAKEAMDRKDARIAALEDKGKQDAVIIKAQGNVIGEMAPKALFADAVATSKSSILVGELAKILKQNGVKSMGQNRLFEWMRRKGYLMKQGSWYNMPTQKSMDLGLFEIKETSITHSDGHVTVNKTPKVTGKGQQYFVNKFLRGKE